MLLANSLDYHRRLPKRAWLCTVPQVALWLSVRFATKIEVGGR